MRLASSNLNMTKDSVIFIMPNKNMMSDGFSLSGYTVCTPYQDKNLFLRGIREM